MCAFCCSNDTGGYGLETPPEKRPSTSDIADEDSISSLKTSVDKVAQFELFETAVQDVQPKDKIRVDYLRKLSDHKVWVPKDQRPPDHQSLIIFDWDDTLMYSTFLLHGASYGVSAVTRQHLQRIEKAACDLLDISLGLGRTFIITNAQEGWVEECVTRYMPSLKEIMQKIPVISARTEHEAECDGNVSQWKQRAFLKLGKHLDKDIVTNLVAVGDSVFEMDAAQLLSQQFSKSLIKTVKLQESPSPEELVKELDLIVSKFQKIVEKATNMKIRLERRLT